MYCSQCGAQNSDDAKFCTSCGSALHAVSASAATKGSANPAKEPEKDSVSEAKASMGQMFNSAEKGVQQVAENISKKRYRVFEEPKTKLTICILIGVIGSVLGCIMPYFTASFTSFMRASRSVSLIQSGDGFLIILGAVVTFVLYNLRKDKAGAVCSGATAAVGLINIFHTNSVVGNSGMGIFLSYGIGYYLLLAASVVFAIASYLLFKELKASK